MNENLKKEMKYVFAVLLLFGFVSAGSMIVDFTWLDLFYFAFLIFFSIRYLFLKLSHR